MKVSIFEKLGKDKLQQIIDESASIKEVIQKCELSIKGLGNYTTFSSMIKKLDLNLDGLNHRRKINTARHTRNFHSKNVPMEEVFKENSSYSRAFAKRQILRRNLIEEKCQSCGLGKEWNYSSLTLQLDHINGKNKDHRIENLRFLCPNCHSQTHTYCGKATKIHNNPKRKCKCGNRKHFSSTQCQACQSDKRRILPRLTKEQLDHLRQEKKSWDSIGNLYNVSGQSVRKYAKKIGYLK